MSTPSSSQPPCRCHPAGRGGVPPSRQGPERKRLALGAWSHATRPSASTVVIFQSANTILWGPCGWTAVSRRDGSSNHSVPAPKPSISGNWHFGEHLPQGEPHPMSSPLWHRVPRASYPWLAREASIRPTWHGPGVSRWPRKWTNQGRVSMSLLLLGRRRGWLHIPAHGPWNPVYAGDNHASLITPSTQTLSVRGRECCR